MKSEQALSVLRKHDSKYRILNMSIKSYLSNLQV